MQVTGTTVGAASRWRECARALCMRRLCWGLPTCAHVRVPLARCQDITQQHLCDPTTVSLIEKCARLHIHCAHFMCEEPMSSFDAKINNENMTKCLQSLKEMYQDLRGRGVSCASEAEFQGYNVLLNLNKGDILRCVRRLRRPEMSGMAVGISGGRCRWARSVR